MSNAYYPGQAPPPPTYGQPGFQPAYQPQPYPGQPTTVVVTQPTPYAPPPGQVVYVEERRNNGCSASECCCFALCAFCCALCLSD